jgi:hypothetical protein
MKQTFKTISQDFEDDLVNNITEMVIQVVGLGERGL